MAETRRVRAGVNWWVRKVRRAWAVVRRRVVAVAGIGVLLREGFGTGTACRQAYDRPDAPARDGHRAPAPHGLVSGRPRRAPPGK
ncbi:hypothetical protein GCM10018987_34740 [Streptomyces cremeus]